MKRKILASFSVIFIILVFICTGIIVNINKRITPNPDGTIGNTAGNLYNGGYFCEDDGYVYFSNPYDNYAMYRMKPDETELEKIVETETCSINAAGKYIYFYQTGSGSGEGFGYVISTTGVYRAQKEKPHNITCLDRVLGESIILADNSVYYNAVSQSEGVTLKRVDITGENHETILDYKVSPACVSGSALYYSKPIENGHLMKLKLGTKNATDILSEDIYMPIVEGNSVYCIDIHNNYALVRFDLTTGEKEVLAQERTDMFNVSNQYIYYQTSGETPQLKRVTKDGSSSEVIADGAYNKISLTSQYAYFCKFGADTPVYKTPLNGAVSISTFDAAFQAAAKEMKK